MKHVILAIMVMCVVSISLNAALVPNGDFESPVGTAEGWDVWSGGGEVNADEYITEGNPDGYVDLDAAAGTWAGWYQTTPLSFDVLGAPAGSTITLQADIKNFSGALDCAGLKLEAKGGAEVQNGWQDGVTTDWKTYSVDLVTNPDNTGLIFSLTNVPVDGSGASVNGYDNAELIVDGKALFPVPHVGATLSSDAIELTWSNPDPNYPGETVIASAYLLECDAPLDSDPNLGPIDFNGEVPGGNNVGTIPGTTLMELAVTDNIANVSGLLVPDKYYYWAVHVTDPNGGGPVTSQGFVWDFVATGDSIPKVNAGDDRYLVTTGNGMQLSLDAMVEDDEDEGPVSITWADITEENDKNPNTTVTFDPNNLVQSPKVILTNAVDGNVNGYYQFEITVDDGVNDPVTDQVVVGVYATCADAAEGDPADDWDSTGDLDGNCKVELADFALMAENWLGCNANRLGEASCP